ncbi:hypothetical protein ACET3Z_010965 [Daucus carota]
MSNLNGDPSTQDVPHVESSDSEHSYTDSEEEGTQISEDSEEENDNEVAVVYSNALPPKSCLDLAAEDEDKMDMFRTVLRDIDSKWRSPSVDTEDQS